MFDVRSYILERFPGQKFNERGKLHARCPFHEDSHPSFSITDEGLFVCGAASCGIRGNFNLFYKLSEGITTWAEVHSRLTDTTPHIASTLEELLGGKKKEKAEELKVNPFPFEPFIEPVGSVEYLEKREISRETIEKYGIVYGTGGIFDGVDIRSSLVFPIYDLSGVYWTFQARLLRPGGRRWLHPTGSPSSYLLYGGWLVHPGEYLWIVEGPSDVWRMDTLGQQAVGLFTKQATPKQLNSAIKLCRNFDLTPVVCLDGDTYGRINNKEVDYGKTIFNELYVSGLKPRLVHLEREEDPGSLSVARLNQILSDLQEGDNARAGQVNREHDRGAGI